MARGGILPPPSSCSFPIRKFLRILSGAEAPPAKRVNTSAAALVPQREATEGANPNIAQVQAVGRVNSPARISPDPQAVADLRILGATGRQSRLTVPASGP